MKKDEILSFIEDNIRHFEEDKITYEPYLDGIIFGLHVVKNFIKYDGKPFELHGDLTVTHNFVSDH